MRPGGIELLPWWLAATILIGAGAFTLAMTIYAIAERAWGIARSRIFVIGAAL